MSTAELKSNLHKLIDGIEDNSVLHAVYAILAKLTNRKEVDFWDELTVDQQNEVLEGMKQIEEGKGIPHEQVMGKYRQWL